MKLLEVKNQHAMIGGILACCPLAKLTCIYNELSVYTPVYNYLRSPYTPVLIMTWSHDLLGHLYRHCVHNDLIMWPFTTCHQAVSVTLTLAMPFIELMWYEIYITTDINLVPKTFSSVAWKTFVICLNIESYCFSSYFFKFQCLVRVWNDLRIETSRWHCRYL